jgi:hypothetical protein
VENWTAEEIELRQKVEKGLAVVCNSRVSGPYKNLVSWAKNNGKFTYIGRRNWHYEASKWRNEPPKEIRQDNVKAVNYFVNEIYNKRPDLGEAIGELKGQVLGCWCKPLPCHGDFLAEQANLKKAEDDQKILYILDWINGK